MLRVVHNLRWLRDANHVLLILGGFSLLPALWPVVARWMPAALRRIHLALVASVGGLLIVANVYEPRAFGEPLILAYVGVAVGGWRWVQGEETTAPTEEGWLRAIERWGAMALVAAWILVVLGLSRP